jgi:hypothetical protein
LERVRPGVGAPVAALLRGPQQPPLEVTGGRLEAAEPLLADAEREFAASDDEPHDAAGALDGIGQAERVR